PQPALLLRPFRLRQFPGVLAPGPLQVHPAGDVLEKEGRAVLSEGGPDDEPTAQGRVADFQLEVALLGERARVLADEGAVRHLRACLPDGLPEQLVAPPVAHLLAAPLRASVQVPQAAAGS